MDGAAERLLSEYLWSLSGRSGGTVEAYARVLRQFATWLTERPGSESSFRPEQLTRTAVETYLAHLEAEGYSISHGARVKSAISGFARWLIEEKGVLRRNPTRGVDIPTQPLLAPRQLSPDQRYVLRELVEHEDDVRGSALFALGYYAGCRVSDVSWLRTEHAYIGPKIGWLHVGHKGGKARDIDLANGARRPHHEYLQSGGRDPESPYVFTSQRGERLTEAGIHHWFRSLRARATKAQWELVSDITFHDLRHDFAHRVREAGWSIEEVAYYLGHVTSPALGLRSVPGTAPAARGCSRSARA